MNYTYSETCMCKTIKGVAQSTWNPDPKEFTTNMSSNFPCRLRFFFNSTAIKTLRQHANCNDMMEVFLEIEENW